MELGQHVKVYKDAGALMALQATGFITGWKPKLVFVDGRPFDLREVCLEQTEATGHDIAPANMPRIAAIRCHANGSGFRKPHGKVRFQKSSEWEHRGTAYCEQQNCR
jgi:hypothetical protein